MTSQTMRTWFDEHGQPFEAPADATTCTGSGDDLVHDIFAPFDPFMLQAITSCGIRAGKIPAEGDVNCRECLDVRER